MAMKFRKISAMLALFAAAAVFSQEPQGIKLQLPTDSAGLPLNLQALSAKDTAGFETYSKRYALLQDSISAAYRAIESVKKNAASFMPKLEPKGEFEKQADYDARKQKWDEELKKRIEKDSKSLADRLAELEKAKSKVQDNQASLYGALEVKSTPPAASIYIGKEEIGATPAEYKLLIPGAVKISLRKEGYNPWDTALQVAPGAKLKLSVAMEEKSIFSQENEIDFGKLLAKDADAKGYEARIGAVYARKAEADEEIAKILAAFQSAYPALEPKSANETQADFEKRREAWANEGMRQYAELQKKHEKYRDRLDRSVETLNDYIIALQSSAITEAAMFARIELGAYDSEKETFELVAQDSASRKSPFYFIGKVGVPISSASALNRAAPGFASAVQFINFPFETDSAKVNLAMSKLQLSMGGQALNVDGSFMEIEKYKSMAGYGAWKAHADSILSGALKAQGLDYNYAMGKEAAKALAGGSAAQKESEPGDGLGWRAWTRIAAYSLAAGCAALAALKHIDARKHKDDIDKIVAPTDQPAFEIEKDGRSRSVRKLKDSEGQRMNFGIGAGALALAGTLTFFF